MYTTFKIIGSSEYRNVDKFTNKRAAHFENPKVGSTLSCRSQIRPTITGI